MILYRIKVTSDDSCKNSDFYCTLSCVSVCGIFAIYCSQLRPLSIGYMWRWQKLKWYKTIIILWYTQQPFGQSNAAIAKQWTESQFEKSKPNETKWNGLELFCLYKNMMLIMMMIHTQLVPNSMDSVDTASQVHLIWNFNHKLRMAAGFSLYSLCYRCHFGALTHIESTRLHTHHHIYQMRCIFQEYELELKCVTSNLCVLKPKTI